MTHRLTTNCAKNYCNRTLNVKVIVENVVTCFFIGTQCSVRRSYLRRCLYKRQFYILLAKTTRTSLDKLDLWLTDIMQLGIFTRSEKS